MQKRKEILVFTPAGKLQAAECRECGSALRAGAGFCDLCGSAQAGATPWPISKSRPSIFRRAVAEIIDRLVPLPFLTYFFPVWVLVVVAYHLICDGSPSGQSAGKWVCRLCVVSSATGEPCGIWRSALRRSTTAIGQAAYCVGMMIPFVIAYELMSVAFAWLSPTGRRIEDYLAGTQVITRSAYRKMHRSCATCGEWISVRGRYCLRCGQRAEDE